METAEKWICSTYAFTEARGRVCPCISILGDLNLLAPAIPEIGNRLLSRVTLEQSTPNDNLDVRLRLLVLAWLIYNSLGLVLVWTRDMDPAFLTTAVMITLYFLLGSRLEERKLLVYHGEIYRQYRQLVPSLIPLPWKYLSREKARMLVAAAVWTETGGGGNRRPRDDVS